MDAASQYALAYALTTTAGLRGFLALLAASIAIHLGWIHPSAGFAWLGTDSASLILAVFATLEVLGDKVPAVDHALHAISFVLRPVAAAILVGTTVHAASPGATYAMMAVGAVNALFIHGSAATVRAGSTIATFGLGNVLLSVGEDFIAVGGLAVSFAKPLLGAALALAFAVVIFAIGRIVVGRVRAAAPRRNR
jgi:uncharacterized membrane protein